MIFPLAIVIPGGALGTGLFLVAIPIVLAVTVWAAFTMARILFPEQKMQLGRVPRSVIPGLPSTRIRLHDLLEEEEHNPAAPAMPPRAIADDSLLEADLLWEDLWLRRN